MKSFLYKISIFLLIVLSLLALSLFFMPNHTAHNSLLAALITKHQLLKNQTSPKLVFVGGSNLSFGLDSKKIEEKIGIPVINASLHGGIGLKYQLNDLKPFIKKGDIIVVSPEYSQFYDNNLYGGTELVSILFDIFPQGRKFIDLKQWYHLAQFIPQYSASKLKYKRATASTSIGIYDKNSFNQNGDAYIHWTMPKEKVIADKASESKQKITSDAFIVLADFKKFVTSKSARMYLIPPVYQTSSYNNLEFVIEDIQKNLALHDLHLLTKPTEFKFSDSLFFNTPYHLTKTGVDLRTSLVISHLSKVVDPAEMTRMH